MAWMCFYRGQQWLFIRNSSNLLTRLVDGELLLEGLHGSERAIGGPLLLRSPVAALWPRVPWSTKQSQSASRLARSRCWEYLMELHRIYLYSVITLDIMCDVCST